MLFEVILSAFGGAGVALAIAGFLSKSFIKLQTDKALAIHMQTLTLEKDRLSHNLAVEFHRKSISLTRQEVDRIDALKHMYQTVVKAETMIVKLNAIAKKKRNLKFPASYFDTLAEIFRKLHDTFNDLAVAFTDLELRAIYFDPPLEKQIFETLCAMQNYYGPMQIEFDAVLVQAQALGPVFAEEQKPADLVLMCQKKVLGWQQLVQPTKQLLKQKLRDVVLA